VGRAGSDVRCKKALDEARRGEELMSDGRFWIKTVGKGIMGLKNENMGD
jgi:hypothetical protein